MEVLKLQLEKKFPHDSLSFLQDYSIEQLNCIAEHIFDNSSLEQLKELIQKNNNLFQ